jgi:N-acetylneuraminic acid mutarotase
MSKSVALLFVLFFLTASCVMVAKPAFSSADIAEDSWETKASMQQARAGLGVAVVNGKIYAIGGTTLAGSWPYTGGIVATNEEYDPATNTWSFKKPMPTPRKNFGIAVYNNKIYCIGGEEIFKDESRAPLTNVNEVYDPATDTWETKEPMPTPRSDLRANVVNGKIYLIGGYDPNVHFEPGASTHNEVYDLGTDSWFTKEPLIAAASNYASAVFDDKIYVIGGFIEGPWLRFDLNQIYNTKNDSWSYGAPLSQGYGGVTGVVTAGFMAPKRIYVFGEMRNGFGEEYYYSVRSYDPENDSWTAGADMLTGRGGLDVAVVNDVIYVIGGETANGMPFSADPPSLKKYATNEQYIPFGYGTIPPKVSVASPKNANYTSSEIKLNFTVNRHVEWMGYSLDRQDNVTVTGNVTLSGLTNGFHNVTVYVRDEFENTVASETISFNVDVLESFPTLVVTAVTLASVSVVGVGLLFYFKKRKKSQGKKYE